LGERIFNDERGALVTYDTLASSLNFRNIVPDNDGGAVAVWQQQYGDYNIFAKHINPDGSLGGPVPDRIALVSEPRISGYSNGHVYFELKEANIRGVEIYDLLGRCVDKVYNISGYPGFYTARIDLSKLISGIYFVKVNTNLGQYIIKTAIIK